MSSSLLRPVLNLGNSIVGVSILTMPWCFTQTGVLLGVLLLVFSALVTTWTCKMLLRAAQMTRQHTYETLGHAVYGSLGKLGIEISNIGLGIGTCVGFYIIIGDLLPPLVAQFFGINWNANILRAVLLVLSGLVVAFPLTLIRNVDRLSVISIGSLAFYFFFILQLIYSSRSNITWNVWSGLVWWRTENIFKCLPIFSIAFCCQSQMFVIYTSLREANVKKMSTVVDGAVWMVATAYLSVAVFGYLSYCNEEIKGDVLANFPLNSLSQATRFAFAVTVMLSFPLIVFPCRVSLNSLLCADSNLELHVTPPIPQQRFVAITAGIMFSTLTLAILIPHIQTVLALVGATLGSLICFIFPGLFLSKVAGSKSEFSLRAKFCIGLGLCVLVVSTLVTLNSWSEEGSIQYHIKPANPDPIELPPTPLPPDNELPVLKKDDDSQNEAQDKRGEENVEREAEKEVDKLVNNPVIDSPEKEINAVVDAEDKKDVDLHGKLEQLAERLEKLEEENKDLKERQDEIEKVKDEEPQVPSQAVEIKDPLKKEENKNLQNDDQKRQLDANEVVKRKTGEDLKGVHGAKDSAAKIDSPPKAKLHQKEDKLEMEAEKNQNREKLEPPAVDHAVDHDKYHVKDFSTDVKKEAQVGRDL